MVRQSLAGRLLHLFDPLAVNPLGYGLDDIAGHCGLVVEQQSALRCHFEPVVHRGVGARRALQPLSVRCRALDKRSLFERGFHLKVALRTSEQVQNVVDSEGDWHRYAEQCLRQVRRCHRACISIVPAVCSGLRRAKCCGLLDRPAQSCADALPWETYHVIHFEADPFCWRLLGDYRSYGSEPEHGPDAVVSPRWKPLLSDGLLCDGRRLWAKHPGAPAGTIGKAPPTPSPKREATRKRGGSIACRAIISGVALRTFGAECPIQQAFMTRLCGGKTCHAAAQ
jgi:hypothetical protein